MTTRLAPAISTAMVAIALANCTADGAQDPMAADSAPPPGVSGFADWYNAEPTPPEGGDADGDADSDTDADGDELLTTDERTSRERCQYANESDASLAGYDTWGICSDGSDEDGDGLVDCDDFGCLEDPGCCAPTERAWVDDLASCGVGLSGCSWAEIPSQGGTVNVAGDGTVRLGGEGDAISGIASAPIVGLGGGPAILFVGAFDDATCGEGSCSQVFGVALTSQRTISGATGVAPLAGVVLDGESRAIQYVVAGHVAFSVPFDDGAGPASVHTPLLYAFRIYPDGAVGFWSRRNAEDASGLTENPPEFTSAALLAGADTTELRVVIFGRLDGTDMAHVSSLRLDSRVCDLPDVWSRPSASPVALPTGPDEIVRNPAVFEAGGALHLIYDDGVGLVEVTSGDSGESWGGEQRILAQGSSTGYGAVAMRAPTVLASSDGVGETPTYHLWYEAEAQAGSDTPAGVTPTAILHAVSDDGETWVEAEEPIAIEAQDAPWLARVGSPTVAPSLDGVGFLMLFDGAQASGGETGLMSATSDDGKVWTVAAEPVQFGAAEGAPLEFERDGRSEPEVSLWGDVYRLWYVGLDGAHSAIGYAVSSDGVRWQPFGQVLEAGATWEQGRVGGPSVVSWPTAETGTALLRMWYDAGASGRERIGVAAREVPAL
jgi:hypothetical protein